jgi:hypothetical protein
MKITPCLTFSREKHTCPQDGMGRNSIYFLFLKNASQLLYIKTDLFSGEIFHPFGDLKGPGEEVPCCQRTKLK